MQIKKGDLYTYDDWLCCFVHKDKDGWWAVGMTDAGKDKPYPTLYHESLIETGRLKKHAD